MRHWAYSDRHFSSLAHHVKWFTLMANTGSPDNIKVLSSCQECIQTSTEQKTLLEQCQSSLDYIFPIWIPLQRFPSQNWLKGSWYLPNLVGMQFCLSGFYSTRWSTGLTWLHQFWLVGKRGRVQRCHWLGFEDWHQNLFSISTDLQTCKLQIELVLLCRFQAFREYSDAG